MIRRTLSAITLLFGLSSPAFAFQECKFSFEIDTQSSAFQARIRDAQETGGLWRPIREAPDDVRAISRYIGRLDICLVTPDGKPREISVNGQTTTLQSPHVTSCTAALLPNNRLLTNRHCFFEDTLAAAGFSIVQEARINFDYVAKDFTDNVKTFLVLNREVALDEKLDAMVLQVIGGDANEALGGHIPLVMETRATPRRKMTMVHHPRGLPQQYSDYTCQIHPDQNMLPEAASQLRHRCESAGGSSGSLLLDARSLAVVGLHNQGGMGPQGGYNGGHKIEMINAALGLGFTQVAAPAAPVNKATPDPLAEANAALVAAMLEQDPAQRSAALMDVINRFYGTPVAESAKNVLAMMAPPSGNPVVTPAPAPVLKPTPRQAPTVAPVFTGRHMANEMTIVSWGGAYSVSQQKAYNEPYAKRSGVNIIDSNDSYMAVSEIRRMNRLGNVTWDVVDVVAADAIRLCDEGLALEIDPDTMLAAAPDGTPASQDFGNLIVSDCFIPQIVYSHTFGYRSDFVGRTPPTSVCDVFDTRTYPGKRALEARPANNMVWALLCDGVARQDIYKVLATTRGQNRALAKLDTIKNDVIWWSAGAETPQLLADGEVVMGSTYNGRLFSLIEEQRAPVAMLWDAQVLDLDGWVIPKGLSPKRQARALDYVIFATDTQRLADQAKYIAYGPARASSAPLIGRHADLGIQMAPHMTTNPKNMRNAFLYNYGFWSDNLDTIDAKFQAWLAR